MFVKPITMLKKVDTLKPQSHEKKSPYSEKRKVEAEMDR
jgi:hypothetical protein